MTETVCTRLMLLSAWQQNLRSLRICVRRAHCPSMNSGVRRRSYWIHIDRGGGELPAIRKRYLHPHYGSIYFRIGRYQTTASPKSLGSHIVQRRPSEAPFRFPCGELPQHHHFCRASASASQPRRSFSSGILDKYGLISRIGVPSSMSTPRTCSSMPSRRRSSTVVRPIGFGRRGDRVANTPCDRWSEGGVLSNWSPRNSSLGERSNSQMTMRCEKPSMSVSPGSNSGRILSTPSASCLAPSPLGTSLASLYGLLTNPIGREVNIREKASISHTNAGKAGRSVTSGRIPALEKP